MLRTYPVLNLVHYHSKGFIERERRFIQIDTRAKIYLQIFRISLFTECFQLLFMQHVNKICNRIFG